MKHRLFRLVCFATLAMTWTSCTKEVDFTGTQSDPLLVVNGLQQVGQPAQLRIEKSTFFLDDQPDCRVKDLRVDLYVNGVFEESLKVRDSMEMEGYIIWSDTGEMYVDRLRYAFNYCESKYILQEDDEVRFEVSSSEFETAIAEVSMPRPPHVISFDTVRVESINEYETNVRFALKLDDPLGDDYYNLYPQGALSGFNSSDPVFADLTSFEDIEDIFGENLYYGYGRYNMFSDRFFDGSVYSLSMEASLYGEEFWPFVLEVSRVDAGFYQYTKSYQAYSNTDPDSMIGMFTEPVQVYSNVKNAIGVVGAQSLPITMTIDLSDFSYLCRYQRK